MTFEHLNRALLAGAAVFLFSACGATNAVNTSSNDQASNLLSTAKSEGAAAYEEAVNPSGENQARESAGAPEATQHQLVCSSDIATRFAQLDPSVTALFQQHLNEVNEAVARLEDIIERVRSLDASDLPPEIAVEKDKILAFLNDRLSCLKSIIGQLSSTASSNSGGAANPTQCQQSGVGADGRVLCPDWQGGASGWPGLILPPAESGESGVMTVPNSVDPSGLGLPLRG